MPKKKAEKKVTSSVTKETATKKTTTKKANPTRKQKIRGGILIAIGLGALIFIGFFLFSKFFRPQPLAELLPTDRTVGFLEVNVDGESGQVQQFYELMKNYPVYQRGGIIALVNQVFPVNFANDLEPWLGRQMAVAILTNSENQFVPLLFIESSSHEEALNFLKGRTLDVQGESIIETEYKNSRIYTYEMSQSFTFAFVEHYLVVAANEAELQSFIDDFIEKSRLVENETYRKVANNLPRGGLAFGYVNLDKLFETLQKDQKFVTQKGQDLLAFKPYLSIFSAEGVSVFAEKDRFTAQTYTSINKDALDGGTYVTFEDDYRGELLNYIAQDPIFFTGGHNLTKEWSRIEEIFKSGTKTPALVFEGIVETQRQRFFGDNVGLKEDIYPLLEGEYAMSIENSLETPIISFLLELKNQENIARFERVVNEFIQVSGVFSPVVQEVELPDGTIAREIVASPEKIEQSTQSHGSATITSLRLGNTGIQIHYTMLDGIVMASSEYATLEQIIDRFEGTESNSLTTTARYERQIKPIIHNADQVLHVKLGALTQLFGLAEDGILEPYLVPWNNFTMTKNFFEDGVSTTYLLEVL